MADSTWAVEKNFRDEDEWHVYKGGYASEAEAQSACDVLAGIYDQMNWRVTEMR